MSLASCNKSKRSRKRVLIEDDGSDEKNSSAQYEPERHAQPRQTNKRMRRSISTIENRCPNSFTHARNKPYSGCMGPTRGDRLKRVNQWQLNWGFVPIDEVLPPAFRQLLPYPQERDWAPAVADRLIKLSSVTKGDPKTAKDEITVSMRKRLHVGKAESMKPVLVLDDARFRIAERQIKEAWAQQSTQALSEVAGAASKGRASDLPLTLENGVRLRCTSAGPYNAGQVGSGELESALRQTQGSLKALYLAKCDLIAQRKLLRQTAQQCQAITGNAECSGGLKAALHKVEDAVSQIEREILQLEKA